jgi:hypothetical protein
MKYTVSAHIHKIQEAVKKEAEEEGDEELLDPDNLYSRFKFNKEHDMKVGNIRLLKYFVANLVIKVYRESIGFWEYTEEDQEMYEYFVSNSNKKAWREYLKFIEFYFTIERALPLKDTKEFVLFVETDISGFDNILEINYFSFFHKKLIYCDELINRSIGKKFYLKENTLFSDKDPFKPEIITISNCSIKEIYVIKPTSNYDKMISLTDNAYSSFIKILKDNLDKNDNYIRLKKELMSCIAPILETVIRENYALFKQIDRKDLIKIKKLAEHLIKE